MDVLGLSHIAHSKIGNDDTRGISGGQRKRVNIAIELAAQPSIMFLDEPTSGLDSTSSLQLIKALRATAKQGITVAAVLHQPRYEMFCLFHDVLLLGKGGFTVYFGPAQDAKQYFESLGYVFPAEVNPADGELKKSSANESTRAFVTSLAHHCVLARSFGTTHAGLTRFDHVCVWEQLSWTSSEVSSRARVTPR